MSIGRNKSEAQAEDDIASANIYHSRNSFAVEEQRKLRLTRSRETIQLTNLGADLFTNTLKDRSKIENKSAPPTSLPG